MADKSVSVGVKEVQALNARISKLNTQRTEVATKIKMYKSSLADELKNYLDSFGVNLSGKTLSETKNLVSMEAERVNATIQEEYELKKKVVELIEMGDIDEANRLLGIVEEPIPQEEPVQEEAALEDDFNEEPINVDDLDLDDTSEEDVDGASGFGEDFGFSTDVVAEDSEVEEDGEVNLDFGSDMVTEDTPSEDNEEVDMDFGFDLSVDEGTSEAETGEVSSDSEESPVIDGDLTVEEDGFEEDFGFGDLLNSGNEF